MEDILQMNNIRKEFPGVIALDNVSLGLKKGEILALLGENGAGKSTLIKILAGAITADNGEIILEDEEIKVTSPSDMINKGISVVYQELNYLNDLNIAENIFIGNLPRTRMGGVDYKKLKKETKRLMSIVGLELDPMTEVSRISLAHKQMVEIAKALSKNSKVLVLDEPTSAIDLTEVKVLFSLLRKLVQQGKSIIYISHKMDEIFEISDRVKVLRDGKEIGTKTTKNTNVDELVNMMVGRSIENMYPKEEIQFGDVAMEIKGLCAKGVKNIDFSVRSGEIVGLFGLLGSGRTEIAECLFGKRHREKGEVWIDGKLTNIKNPSEAIDKGLAYLPRERKSDGLLMMRDVKENITAVIRKKLRKFFSLDLKKEKELAELWVDKLRIKTPSISTLIESLSGGNQQKVVLSKWLMNNPKILILNEPTRGIDVGAKVEIYKLMEEFCRKGIAIIMISSETPEIMEMSDRIFVIHAGAINGELNRCEFDQEKMMHYAIGGR